MIRPYKGRQIDLNKPVYVYRNLADKHNHLGRWSILQGELVVAHSDDVALLGFGDKPVQFVVRPGGFERAQAEQRKNVHAFFKGRITDRPFEAQGLRAVQYDFRRGDRFFDVASDEDLAQAELAWLNENGAFYR